jgi:multiple antibiotic resistance protein
MASTELLVNTFTTLLVTIDPPGLVPVFLGLTAGMTALERRQVALRGSLTAFALLAVFAIFGSSILGALGISMGAFRIAGGLLLFFIAFEMIFEKRTERKEKTSEVAITLDHIRNIAIFPLALPLIAGPAAISATVLTSSQMSSTFDKMILLAIIAGTMLLVYASLLVGERMDRYLGNTGRAILTRLLGVILAALSIQFVIDGIRSAFAL